MNTNYRSLDYEDNVRALKAKGYRYLTFYDAREVPCPDLADEPGYEQVDFREAVPTVKPQEDDGITVNCFPIDSEETILMLDSDMISYGVAEEYF